MYFTGIIGAMSCEIDKIIENMIITDIRELAGIKFYSGTINEMNVVVTCSGIGKVNAAVSTQILIDIFKVNFIINTGVAGGISEKLDIGDIVISSDVTYHDVQPLQMINTFPFMQFFPADDDLIRTAQNVCKRNLEINKKYLTGRIASGEAFIDDSEQKRRIREELDADCVEMEGAAIGHVAHINNVPFIIIRSISDKANEEATINFEEFAINAAKQSSQIVVAMLEELKKHIPNKLSI